MVFFKLLFFKKKFFFFSTYKSRIPLFFTMPNIFTKIILWHTHDFTIAKFNFIKLNHQTFRLQENNINNSKNKLWSPLPNFLIQPWFIPNTSDRHIAVVTMVIFWATFFTQPVLYLINIFKHSLFFTPIFS